MKRPLLISDCDDVLLHFLPHFVDWLEEAHAIRFDYDAPGFAGALRDRDGGILAEEQAWPLLNQFFEGEMHRQSLVAGAAEALGRIGEVADIVILTNVGAAFHAGRIAQLEAHGIRHRVICNQGGKGRPARRLIGEMDAGTTVFVDDLGAHHESVAKHAPEVWRLHMVADPRHAAKTASAPHAHARIDLWDEALPWVLALGFLGAAGHCLLILAYARAPASVLAPLSFTQILWACVAGVLLFGDWPDGWTLLGGAVIGLGGVLVALPSRRARS